MCKRKSLLKKSSAIMLALALTVSPLGVAAADDEQSTEVQSSAVAPTDGENLSDLQKDSAAEKDAVKEQEGTTVSGEESEVSNSETLDAQGMKPSDAEETTESKTEGVEADEQTEDISVSDRQYDTTQPVIEKIIFDQNGTTLMQKDTLKIGVEAYDADSGVESVKVMVFFQDEEASQSYGYEIELTQNADNPKLYEGSYAMEGIVYERG